MAHTPPFHQVSRNQFSSFSVIMVINRQENSNEKAKRPLKRVHSSAKSANIRSQHCLGQLFSKSGLQSHFNWVTNVCERKKSSSAAVLLF